MSDWINLRMNTEDLEKKEANEGGGEYIYSPSPYDVPEAIKAEYDKSKNRLRIQFKYIGEEPLKRLDDKTGISFGMGKNSKRLYEVDVDFEKVKQTATALADFIVDKIKHLADEYKQRQDNYTMAEVAIDSEKERLLAAMPLNAEAAKE